jgi:hypothetical protein
VGIRCADDEISLYSQQLALSSPTSGDRSAGIVRFRTKGQEVRLFFVLVLLEAKNYKIVLKQDRNLYNGLLVRMQ